MHDPRGTEAAAWPSEGRGPFQERCTCLGCDLSIGVLMVRPPCEVRFLVAEPLLSVHKAQALACEWAQLPAS